MAGLDINPCATALQSVSAPTLNPGPSCMFLGSWTVHSTAASEQASIREYFLSAITIAYLNTSLLICVCVYMFTQLCAQVQPIPSAEYLPLLAINKANVCV